MSDEPLTITNYGTCVPFTKDALIESDVSRELRALMVTQVRTQLEQTICVRCRLNFFGCLCTLAELDEYLNNTRMTIRYGLD